MKNKSFVPALLFSLVLVGLTGCDEEHRKTSDQTQHEQQERILAEGTSQIGMPAIHNFRERKLLKDIYELRDQDGLITYTYIFSQMTGKFTFIGESIGYGIPYATQFTNPSQIAKEQYQYGYAVLPQADPNGLFSPADAEGTWVMMVDPTTGKARPQYIEERIAVFTYKLSDDKLNK